MRLHAPLGVGLRRWWGFHCSLAFCMHPPSGFFRYGRSWYCQAHIPAAHANTQYSLGMELANDRHRRIATPSGVM
jgi:hypothetical protein